jgi:hypothetical protein
MLLFAGFYLTGNRRKHYVPLSKTNHDKPAEPQQ